MPEMRFAVRWPDGTEERCYSPSLVVKEHLSVGTEYALDEFVARARAALEEASERVRQRFGFPCGRALGQLGAIERRAAGFAGTGGGAGGPRVAVLSFHAEDGS